MSPCCDLDLVNTKPIFLHDTLAHDDASSDQVWLPKNQQFRRYSRNCLDHMNPCCDLELKNSKPTFLLDTLALDDESQYQV